MTDTIDITTQRTITGGIIITIPISDDRERYIELAGDDLTVHTTTIRDRSRDLVVRRWSRKRDSDGRTKEAVLRDAIVERFRDGDDTPFTIQSITEHVPFEAVTVRRAMSELERKGIVERCGRKQTPTRGRGPILFRYVASAPVPSRTIEQRIESGEFNGRSAPVAGTGRIGTADPEVRSLLREVTRRGATIQPTANGHYRVRLNGRTIATVPGTPSDHRWRRNARAQLRRGGLDV